MSDLEFLYGWDSRAVWRVLHGMRAADAREVFAMMPSDDPAAIFARMQMLHETMPVIEIAFKPTLMGRPVAFLAVTLESPRVGRVHMVATPEMRPRDFAVWAQGIRAAVPDQCVAAGLHRVHCSTMATHAAAHTFLAHCGMAPEGLERSLGRNGEDFVRWVTTRRMLADGAERARIWATAPLALQRFHVKH